jgi:hypothetical protein
METLGWILWTVVLFFCLAGIIFLVKGLKEGIQAQTIVIVITQWILLLSFLVPFNKLHLIWLLPLAYVLPMLGGFFIFAGKWVVLLGGVALYVVVLLFMTPG